jgi:TBC1 domain family protein 5
MHQSPWNKLREDEQLREEILLDVERCMPDQPTFRLPDVQKKLLDILFIYCRLNSDIGYRQGMHEILAPILYVVQSDGVRHDTASELDASFTPYVAQILNNNFVEHDVFTIFNALMNSAKPLYELRTNGSSMPHSGGLSTPAANASASIIERSQHIHENLLKTVDPELSSHISELNILPQVFLM